MYTVHGCRCFTCRVGYNASQRAYRAGQGWTDGEMVPAIGVRRRIQALHAIGWSCAELGQHLGVTRQAVRDLCRPTAELTLRSTHRAVAAMYDGLWDKPSTGPRRNAIRAWARRNGYRPPLAWDDDTIDLPDIKHGKVEPSVYILEANETAEIIDEIAVEQAIGGRRVHLTRAEMTEAHRRLNALGFNNRQIAERLGITTRTATRQRTKGTAA